MLLALFRFFWPKETEPTRKRRGELFVTPEQLELALEEHMKDITFEWNEWYEKFDKLHLRLSKRAARMKEQEQQLLQVEREVPRRTSVRDYPSPFRRY